MPLVEERLKDHKVLRLSVGAWGRAWSKPMDLWRRAYGHAPGWDHVAASAKIYLRPRLAFRPNLGEGHVAPWRRHQRCRKGLTNFRLVRYADDFVLLVPGIRAEPRRSERRSASCWPPSCG